MEMIADVQAMTPSGLAVVQAKANPGRADAGSQLAGEFLIFRLGAEEYGIDILQVQEIRSYEAPTRIANTPDFIKGVINLRDVIVPILDLRLKFALASVEYNNLTVTIVLNIGRRVVGMVVDGVSDVLPLNHAQIRPVPEFDPAADTRFITGIGTAAGDGCKRMLILVDIGRLISANDLDLVASGAELVRSAA